MTKTKRTGLWLLPLMLAAPAAWAQPGHGPCEHRDTVELSGPATAALQVVSGAGGVEITGEPGLAEFQVDATLCAASRELLEGLAVSLEGGRVETTYPERQRGGWRFWRRNYASIHLGIRVPVETAIELEDGSGSITVSEVGGVTVTDGSGSIRLRRTGAVRVDDRSGSLRISEARGSVVVEDGSGSLTIEDVTGDVSVEDGSGSFAVRDIAGNVTLEDGSGDFTVRGVSGDVLVSDDGSGSIRIEEVGGSVTVHDAGSGSVRVADVEGGLTVTGTRRSRIRHRNVRGEVDLPPERRRGRDRR